MDVPPSSGTGAPAYARRLSRLEGVWWKRLLDVQRPYRWNLRRLEPGVTLDLGCGLGRNLAHLDGNGVGIDHNREAVRIARERGIEAFTPEDFAQSSHARPGAFDSLLCAHVLEHMTRADAAGLLAAHLAFVRPGGRVILITPQERGFRSDSTHVEFLGFDELQGICDDLGLTVERRRSFPFPRVFGSVFPYNESVVVARVPS